MRDGVALWGDIEEKIDGVYEKKGPDMSSNCPLADPSRCALRGAVS